MPMRMREEQKDRALHVSCEGWTGVAFGVTLFADVCTDVAALAIQKEGGEAALRLFDPYAPAEDVFAGGWPKGVRIALRPERNIFVAVSAATLFPFVILPCRAWQGMLSSNSDGGPYGQTILAGRL